MLFCNCFGRVLSLTASSVYEKPRYFWSGKSGVNLGNQPKTRQGYIFRTLSRCSTFSIVVIEGCDARNEPPGVDGGEISGCNTFMTDVADTRSKKKF